MNPVSGLPSTKSLNLDFQPKKQEVQQTSGKLEGHEVTTARSEKSKSLDSLAATHLNNTPLTLAIKKYAAYFIRKAINNEKF